MTFEATTLEILEASAAITSEVGRNIFFGGIGAQEVKAPYIVCRIASTTPTLSTDNGQEGAYELDNIRLEVSVHARTLSQCNALAKLCRRALEAARGTTYVLQDTIHDYTELPDTFVVIADFSCWHPDQIVL